PFVSIVTVARRGKRPVLDSITTADRSTKQATDHHNQGLDTWLGWLLFMTVSAVASRTPSNAKVSDGSQPLMTFDLSLNQSAGSRSLHRLVGPSTFRTQC